MKMQGERRVEVWNGDYCTTRSAGREAEPSRREAQRRKKDKKLLKSCLEALCDYIKEEDIQQDMEME